MKVLNYEQVARLAARRRPAVRNENVQTHKQNQRPVDPVVSIILLDWSCRERYDTLEWLAQQDVPRDRYELIWVELYDRPPHEALQWADTVITLGQTGMYHKHVGYNVGLLAARGKLLTICDSDAVFPQDFVSSILRSFASPAEAAPFRPLVLMHHELRTSLKYPKGLVAAAELKDQDRWHWWPLNPNAGACLTVRREDAIRYGGFDEHGSYRGYLCGPYDLGWRLVNAGLPEEWHDPSVALWHFAHPDPIGTNGLMPSLANLLENTHPHVDLHALTAVEAFSAGRMLPLIEHPEIHRLRLKARRVGTAFEEKYGCLTGPDGFSPWLVARLRLALTWDLLTTAVGSRLARVGRWAARKVLGEHGIKAFRTALGRPAPEPRKPGDEPQLVATVNAYNIIRFRKKYFGVPQTLGRVDFYDARDLAQPAILKYPTQLEVEEHIRRAG